jgi:hypothetical protein
MSRIPRRMVMLPRTRALTNRQRPVDNRSWERRAEHEGLCLFYSPFYRLNDKPLGVTNRVRLP